jgi:hypothetical protein
MIKEVIVQKEPPNCANCLLSEYVEGLMLCRYYPKFKKIGIPINLIPNIKPPFCKIKALIVHEEEDD